MPIQVLFDEADFKQSNSALLASRLKPPPPPSDSGVSGPPSEAVGSSIRVRRCAPG
jgi:hypothetical protein